MDSSVNWATLVSVFRPPPVTSRRALGSWWLGPCAEIPKLPSTSSNGFGSRLGELAKVACSMVRSCGLLELVVLVD